MTVEHDTDFFPPSTGWYRSPAEVERVCGALRAEGRQVAFAAAASHLMVADDAPVFFWEAESAVLGSVLGSWNQGQVGTCVSFGYGRGAQDLLLLEVANKVGDLERWPGDQVATEPIYALSRVEVGGGRINGDGSVGAWAAKAVRDWGILLRRKYASHDLSRYSESLSRSWGDRGLPDDLEPEARKHPVTEVALVSTVVELWAAIGAWKPVPVCSGQGFTTTLSSGYCEPQGSWAHCMLFRGRFIHPRRGKSFVIQNSWGGYLRGERSVEVEGRGVVQLPEGCFCTTEAVAARMLAERDSFALAGLRGWAAERLDWTP